MMPLCHILFKVPHEDKKVMEDLSVGSEEPFTIIHASWLVDGERQVRRSGLASRIPRLGGSLRLLAIIIFLRGVRVGGLRISTLVLRLDVR